MSQRDHASHKRDYQQGVQDRVERVPEAEVEDADLPEFANLIEKETSGEDVEESFDYIEVTTWVDGVDRSCI